jgi:acetylornithine/N-succinyldiaminopimelate aminotransferase
MELFDVYPLFDITPVKAAGSYVWDNKGVQYLDLYGGHAVISIGHSHPHYVKALSGQLSRIGFYSNSVKMPLQQELAEKLGEACGYPGHRLFLCNSGAEANENAFKLASFHTGRKKIVAFQGSFHGRTSLAVAATDDPSIVAPVNLSENVIFCPWDDIAALDAILATEEVAAVIIEGIQGVAGVNVPVESFLNAVSILCRVHGTLLILDEIQSGCGRTGRYFAHQHSGIKADIITMAKGIGNGFPIAAVLIHPDIQARHGLLGTTFGGAHLACAAAIAVLEVMKEESLIENAAEIGNYMMSRLQGMQGIRQVRGLGLMIGIELEVPCAAVRAALLKTHRIFTGSSANRHTLRILPALNIRKEEADRFLSAFAEVMTTRLSEKQLEPVT